MNSLEQKKEAFERLLNIMDELREKCPWDKIQTIENQTVVLEENKKAVDCSLCGMKSKCLTKNVWAKVELALNKTLGSITLKNLIARNLRLNRFKSLKLTLKKAIKLNKPNKQIFAIKTKKNALLMLAKAI